MNDESVLKKLGFTINDEGRWQLNGKHQTFIADVITYNGPVYVTLKKLHPDIDERELSCRKGLNYISTIKDCVSEGSIERAIEKYDIPEEFFQYFVGGISLKNAL